MNIKRRIAALEKGLITEPAILTMPDGRTVSITGHGDYLLSLFWNVISGHRITAVQASQLELIRQSTSSRSRAGGKWLA